MEAQWGAVLAERGRLAREIHDTLAQGFVGISVQLELVARLLSSSSEAALQQLDQARALVRASLAEARTSIWDLRSESRGRRGPAGTAAARAATGLPVALQPRCTFR